MTHAGNAISILGIHEYYFHGKMGLDGASNHPKIYPLQLALSKGLINKDYRALLEPRAKSSKYYNDLNLYKEYGVKK